MNKGTLFRMTNVDENRYQSILTGLPEPEIDSRKEKKDSLGNKECLRRPSATHILII